MVKGKEIRANIRVHGIVQGVGFRPFIHKQISEYSLCGWIRNTSFGAEIEIEGERGAVHEFINEIELKAPKLAVIEKVEPEYVDELKGYKEFKIIESKSLDSHDTLISPDICICDDCLREMRDPANPRYMYPFINCTNCGPRFTIIRDIPYDRDKTTMEPFKMCDSCHSEYTDIEDRRYHAQPDCCPECGPSLMFLDEGGRLVVSDENSNVSCIEEPKKEQGMEILFQDEISKTVCDKYENIKEQNYQEIISDLKKEENIREYESTETFKNNSDSFIQSSKNKTNIDSVKLAQQYLQAGKIVAVKGLGGMHLACRYDSPEIAVTLRHRKQRDEKPFALMMRDADAARKLCFVSEDEEKILAGFRRPIVLLEKKDKDSYKYISENNYIGIMLPYTPLHYLLFEGAAYDGLIMTSANLSDLPIMFKNEEAVEKLQGIADAFLLHNREIETRCDDSLMWVVEGKEYPVRRSRGYVPFPVKIIAEGTCEDVCHDICYLNDEGNMNKTYDDAHHENCHRVMGNGDKACADAFYENCHSNREKKDNNCNYAHQDNCCSDETEKEKLFSQHILACGAEQKATFALAKESYVFTSQHVGDLKNFETLENYEKQIKHFERMFSIKPEIIACDLHPDYLSTGYAVDRAEKEDLKIVQVQHHHAHMASCMADNNINGQCIGIIWDGTGLGGEYEESGSVANFRSGNRNTENGCTWNGVNVNGDGGIRNDSLCKKNVAGKGMAELKPDGTVWGGEFLVGDYSGFARMASIKPFRLPGGDKAAKEIWRCGVSLLHECGVDANRIIEHISLLNSALDESVKNTKPNEELSETEKGEGFNLSDSNNRNNQNNKNIQLTTNQIGTVMHMLEGDINCPTCTSMGRLFDGIASLLGIKQNASYEGQGAILLEAAACDNEDGVFPYEIIKSDKYYSDYTKMVSYISDCVVLFMDTNAGTGANSHAMEEPGGKCDVAKFTRTQDGIHTNVYAMEEPGGKCDVAKFTQTQDGIHTNVYAMEELCGKCANVNVVQTQGCTNENINIGDKLTACTNYLRNERNNNGPKFDDKKNTEINLETISDFKITQSHLAAKFMNTIVDMAVEMAKLIREDTGINKVVLSGGTFQNQYMLKRLCAKLRNEKFDVFHHSRVSTNDEGIALGQIMVANSMMTK